MPHVLFVYDHPDSLASLTEETRQAVYEEYQALADIPDMVGHRLQPGSPGTTLTVENDREPPRIETLTPTGLRIIGLYLVDTDDADRATQLAARIPAARHGGAIQIHRLAGE